MTSSLSFNNYTIFIFLTQLKSLANTQSALDDIDNLKNVTDKADALKDIGEKYSRETLKEALAQSELKAEQIKSILIANEMQGELLETTTNQLANAASANKMAKAQKAASSSTLELGKAFKGLGIKLGNMIKAHPILAVTTAVIALGAVIGKLSKQYFLSKYKTILFKIRFSKGILHHTARQIAQKGRLTAVSGFVKWIF